MKSLMEHPQKQVAVVTGAAGGIGFAVSKELVRRGVRAVAMVDQNDLVVESAQAVNELTRRNFLVGFGQEMHSDSHEVALAFRGDVTDAGFRAAVFRTMRERFGLPTICVPAAGVTRDDLAVRVDKSTGKASIYPVEKFRFTTEVNLIAPVYWAMELIAGVAEDRQARALKRWTPSETIAGCVIFIGSIASGGNKGQVAYSATKAGLEGAAATLSMEAMFHGVRCGVIHPGFTDTPMVRALGEQYLKEKILPQTQLGRLIQPDEIADAICFMISNTAVSGQLWADAGWRPAV